MPNFMELLNSPVTAWFIVMCVIVYAIYTLIRAYSYFEYGVKETLIGWGNKELRFYHILIFIIEIPAVLFGRIYHVFKWAFSFRVYTFKEDNKK